MVAAGDRRPAEGGAARFRRRRDFGSGSLALLAAVGLRLAAQGPSCFFTGASLWSPGRLSPRLAARAVADAPTAVGSRLAEELKGPKEEVELSPLGLPPLNKRTFLVTGGTSGIGKATVEMLAKEGCTIIVHGRDAGRIRHIMDKFKRLYKDATFDGYEADLSLGREVREMAEMIRERHPVIHGILHNAASMDGSLSGKKTITWEQEEHTIAVNTLAPFLLTAELLPNLQASGAGRVLFSGSLTMSPDGEHIDDLDCERKWSGIHAYSLSKLAGAMMTDVMHERYGDAPRLTFHTFDAGVADTKLGRHGASWSRGPRKGRSQKVSKLYYGTLPNPRTRRNSFEALTEDDFQAESGRRLQTENGADVMDNDEARDFLWDELVDRTQAEWPATPKLLSAKKEAPQEEVPQDLEDLD